MSKKRSSCFFAEINQVECQYPWLSYDESCEVLVVGGGMTGALCLYELTKQGVDAVMVSQKPIGFSSAQNCSMIQYQNEIMLTELTKQLGKEEAIGYYRLCQQAYNELSELEGEIGGFDFIQRDSFLYTNSPEEVNRLHSEYLMRRHNGFDVEFLEKADAREHFSFEVKAGILGKNLGGELDGFKLCHALASASEDGGARIYENTAVTEMENDDSHIIVTTAYGRTIKAKKVILAIGKQQSGYLSEDIGLKSSFTLVTKPVNGFLGYESRSIVHNLDRQVSLRSTRDNRLMISGLDCNLFDRNSRLGKVIGVERVIERKFVELEDILQQMMTAIEEICVDYEIHTEYPTTKTGLPILGESEEYKGIFFAMPSTPNGVLQSQIIATTLTEQIRKELDF